MKTELRIIKKVKEPKLLVVTPLLPTHNISKDTKNSIKRNDIEFDWIAGIGENNIPTNLENVLKQYKYDNGKKTPKYYIMIDNDIVLGRYMLDRMFKKIEKSESNEAYVYASFKFKGHINAEFPAVPFNIKKLLYANYISSNSMFKLDITENVGLVTDDQYKRLLDWAFLLKLLGNGYIGLNCPEASFVAMSSEKDISAGSREDYSIKSKRVYNDFIHPFVEGYKSR
jgi:hypothetical protein